MKFKLLAIAMSVVCVSCVNIHSSLEGSSAKSTVEKSAASNTDLSIEKNSVDDLAIDSSVVTSISTPLVNQSITLEQIMADPDWLGRQPESWYWGDDSNTVYYQRKRQGNILRDLYVKHLNEDKSTKELKEQSAVKPSNGDKVNLADLHKVSDKNAVLNNTGSQEVYTFEGNVFVKTLATGDIHQLTYTSAVETDPMFLTNGDIAYRVGNIFYRFDIKNNKVIELANILMNQESKKNNEKPASDSYLAKQQAKLIDYVALQNKNTQLKKDQKRNWRVKNSSITQTHFYFSKDLKVIHASLSPSGNKIIVSVADIHASSNTKNVMPQYVTSKGNIETTPVRSRVADNRLYHEYIYLLDITDGTMAYLPYDTLPGYDDDVLADVRKENYAKNGLTYQSKKSPRYIHVMETDSPIKWNNTGDNAAILFEAWDNKDRWLASIDFDNKALVAQHRLHDKAWINWVFNEFGWLNNKALYYLSEESGYSHLYVKELNKKAKQLTSGAFEVSSLTLSSDETSLFYRANENHPGIYEIYKINVNSQEVTQLTDLGGNNRYQLSPDNSKLLLSHSRINMPPELYVETVDAIPQATRLTYTVSDEFLAMPWSMPSIVAIESSIQKAPIYSKVYLPDGFKNSDSKNKGVMFSHGAGYLQNSHLGWSSYFREYMFHSLLVQKGYVVIDMDYRASAGYGRDWRTAIYRHMGKPEIEDMRDGVNWLVEHANVDRKRIGTYGGSYGGFLTLMTMFTQPDLFQAGAALRLVSDWAYYNHQYTSDILNTPYDDAIAYERSSPIYFAQGLQKPLLINAPMVDDNVFFQDTVRLVQRLIELEKQNFETAIYPVEPHGFVQPTSWLDEYRRILKLFETTL